MNGELRSSLAAHDYKRAKELVAKLSGEQAEVAARYVTDSIRREAERLAGQTLPDLVGSAAQLPWAEEVRLDAFRWLAAWRAWVSAQTATNKRLTQERLEQHMEIRLKIANELHEALSLQRDAGNWITNQGVLIPTTTAPSDQPGYVHSSIHLLRPRCWGHHESSVSDRFSALKRAGARTKPVLP